MNYKTMQLNCALFTFLFQAEPSVGSSAETEQEVQSLLGMEDLEAMSFDEVEEAPEFVTPPEGSYRVMLEKADIKTRKNKEGKLGRNINHIYKIMKTLELSDPDAKAPKDYDLFSERWTFTPDGLKYWKTRAKAILGEENGTEGMGVGQVVKMLNDGGFTMDVRLSHRKTKADDGKEYININIQVTERGVEVPEDTL